MGVVASMIVISGWIALRTVPTKRWPLYSRAALAIAIGGGSVLVLITQVVLKLDRWYEPTFVVPLAGMIFAGSMNSVSLSAERIYSELAGGATYEDARRCALNAALIPITNSLFAVGLVSLPGMMTGPDSGWGIANPGCSLPDYGYVHGVRCRRAFSGSFPVADPIFGGRR